LNERLNERLNVRLVCRDQISIDLAHSKKTRRFARRPADLSSGDRWICHDGRGSDESHLDCDAGGRRDGGCSGHVGHTQEAGVDKAKADAFDIRMFEGPPGNKAYACFVRRYDPDKSRRRGHQSRSKFID
jgi:hypothetical protein